MSDATTLHPFAVQLPSGSVACLLGGSLASRNGHAQAREDQPPRRGEPQGTREEPGGAAKTREDKDGTCGLRPQDVERSGKQADGAEELQEIARSKIGGSPALPGSGSAAADDRAGLSVDPEHAHVVVVDVRDLRDAAGLLGRRDRCIADADEAEDRHRAGFARLCGCSRTDLAGALVARVDSTRDGRIAAGDEGATADAKNDDSKTDDLEQLQSSLL